jgi:2'-hydroxyisoflavone reductase
MDLLVLGGTGYLGRHVAELALAGAHSVVVFHRGRSNPDVVAAAEHVLGDRERDLSPLAGRRFDAVVDTTGYEVRHVRAAARALAHPGLRYVFVSSVSVYADLARLDESGPVQTTADAETASLTLERYGALKAACEAALEQELPEQALHVRAGLILGPHDYDERFRYWLTRVARGGEVLAPGDPAAVAQAIDVRDLAAWMLSCAERRVTGTYNATGEPMTMRVLLETVRGVVGGDARFTWVDDEVLVAHGVRPFVHMPFWLPTSAGPGVVPIEKALAAGLSPRPFVETARDAWAWMQEGWAAETTVRENRRLSLDAGMSAEREAEILGAARRG